MVGLILSMKNGARCMEQRQRQGPGDILSNSLEIAEDPFDLKRSRTGLI
jgi:hypothetical protein